MLKQAILRIGAIAFICVTGCQPAAPKPEERFFRGGKAYKTHEEMKAEFPKAQWLEAKQGETSFMFCANDLTAWGVSRMEIQGFVFRRYAKAWENVLTVRLIEVGDVKLSVDPKMGLFSAKGSADNKFKDKSVCTFDLRAAGQG